MAVRIRMKRMGRTHRPFYRICVMDQKVQRDGKAIEEVGTYDPMIREKSKRVTVDLERIDYWLSVGAQPTEKVAVLLRKVREDNWGTVKEPPPMEAPKQPEPEPEPAPEADASAESEETAEAEGGAEETAEAPAEETPAE